MPSVIDHLHHTVLVANTSSQSEVSNLVEDAVREMARNHNSTRFIKFHYAEAEFEPAGVPALLAYRNGDKFAGFVPISDEIPDNEELSAKTLTSLLQRYVAMSISRAWANANSRHRHQVL
jgi:hypothetical protein